MKLFRWILIAALALIIGVPGAAQQTETGYAQVRFFNWVMDGPPLRVFLDDLLLTDLAYDVYSVYPGLVTPFYVPIPEGEYTLNVFAEGEEDGTPLISEPLALYDGEVISLAAYGAQSEDDVRLFQFREETIPGIHDLQNASALIIVHNAPSAPPIRVIEDGTSLVESVEYGAAASVQADLRSSLQIVTSEGGDPLAEIYPGLDQTGMLGVLALVEPPDAAGSDAPFSALYFAHFARGLTLIEADLPLGEAVSFDLAVGERARFTFTPASDLSVVATARGELGLRTQDVTDPVLRIYTADGAAVAFNDDLQRGRRDSVIGGLTLTAGQTYVFEVGSYADLYPGTYTLLVSEPSVTDGGLILPGDSATVTIDPLGTRVRYTLTLDSAALVTIDLRAVGDGDALLRLYDEAGMLIAENDDIEGGVIVDARLAGLQLEAGMYIIEAATYNDTGVGEFTLSVAAE